ncbi:HlyD family secretion protein [Xylophilus sp.]|uniref:HlyD family secretion protein n=1 Tax=Xylophilus sp. TaxID=2653893 RepID=UPI0013BBBCAA|nr:HlyD family secretion protein [Xylophilus sp.]KAF1047420.1 MAG: Multidrug export protein EmrA [Xylophilus sp.]
MSANETDPSRQPDASRDDPDRTADPADANPAAPRKASPLLKRPGVRIGLIVAGAAIVVGGGLYLYRYETSGKYLESTDDAFIQADAVTVAPKISGYVEEVLVQDNQDVRAGQPLVRIDARDYGAQAAQAQAQIDVSRANADAMRAQLREQEAAIAQARAQLTSVQANAEFAASEVQRYAPLVTTGAEPSEQLAAKRNQERQAAGQLAAQRATLAGAERRVASMNAQVRQAEAQGESAQAQLAAAQVNVESAVVAASVDGRVGDRTVRAGQFVQQGTRLMPVVPLASLYVSANFKETQIGRMRPGQPVRIKIDALPDIRLSGHVESIAPGTGAQFSLLPPQNATGNFTKIVQRVPVRIALDAGPEARKVLVPGLSAVVQVDTISARQDSERIRDSERVRQKDGK